MNGLSVDVIRHILSFTCDEQGEYRWDLLRLRVLDRRFNAAITSFRPLWVELLVECGPRKIGEASIHYQDPYFMNKCRLNPDGKCYIAMHYDRETLVPVFNGPDPFDAYKAASQTFRKRWTDRRNRRNRKKQKIRDSNK